MSRINHSVVIEELLKKIYSACCVHKESKLNCQSLRSARLLLLQTMLSNPFVTLDQLCSVVRTYLAIQDGDHDNKCSLIQV